MSAFHAALVDLSQRMPLRVANAKRVGASASSSACPPRSFTFSLIFVEARRRLIIQRDNEFEFFLLVGHGRRSLAPAEGPSESGVPT